MKTIPAITNLLFGQSEYPSPGLTVQQAAAAHATAIGGTAEMLCDAPSVWRVEGRGGPNFLVAAEDLKLRVTRASGRRAAELKKVFAGGCGPAIARYNKLAGALRQGTVRLELPDGRTLRSSSAPNLRSRW